MNDWLDSPPPTDPSRAKAYWCEMNYFLAHTGYGDHPPCQCPEGMGHNDIDPLAQTEIFDKLEELDRFNDMQRRALRAEAALAKPLRETILAVLTTMPPEAAPEHLAAMIEGEVRAWQAIP